MRGEFAVGAVVLCPDLFHLPTMTVEGRMEVDGVDWTRCVWFDERGTLQRAYFPTAKLAATPARPGVVKLDESEVR